MLYSQQKITTKFRDLFKRSSDESILRKYMPLSENHWTGSGREALRQIFLQFQGKKVGFPAYTCHVVLGAAKRAEVEPIFYDSGVIAEIEDIQKIIMKVDALVVCHNFGFIPEMKDIVKLCKENNIGLIEDCAQALGAKYNNQLVGGFGEYATYSFGISKNIGFCGGLISSINIKRIHIIDPFPSINLFKTIAEVIIFPLLFNKWVYPLTYRFLKLQDIHDVPLLQYWMSSFAKKVVLGQMQHYDTFLEKRRKNGEYCVKELKDIVTIIQPIKNTLPSWLYFVIQSAKAEKLHKVLLKKGVDLGKMHTFKCLAEGMPKAMNTEKEVLTLALYRDFDEIKKIVEIIKEVCKNGEY